MTSPAIATVEAGGPASDPGLWNADLAPTQIQSRTWSWVNYAALWIGMVACIPTYMMASGLISSGFSAAQAIVLIFVANVIVLVPMLLTGAAGTRYGVPFPVLLRASFGPQGAKLVALARAFVACGWFGINTWVGGSAIYAVVNILTGNALVGSVLPFLGVDAAQTCCFLLFWAVHLVLISRGTESVRWLEMISAPALTIMGFVLIWWAYKRAHGFGNMLTTGSALQLQGAGGPGWGLVISSLTAMVGFWATLALNICDFTRFSRSQKDQILGQALGLPLPMALFSFIGVAVTSATVVIFGRAIWQPVELASHLGPLGASVALVVVLLCTLSVNMAANVVSPSYDFSNIAPAKISFVRGGYITAAIGLAICPWKLMATAGTYIYVWLVGYSALLGPIAGIMICDYYLVRRRRLIVGDLFRRTGIYASHGGWNPNGLIALAIGVAPNAPGFLHSTGLVSSVPALFDGIFTGAWFVGFFVAAAVYGILAYGQSSREASSGFAM
jgi:nucleobase:cation symporter-1, NCS1 family